MTVLRPRTRLVYFRVSEDEYERLNALCHQAGARSLSDLVRRSLLERSGPDGAGGEAVEALAERIDRLARLIEELRQRFDESPEVKPGLRM